MRTIIAIWHSADMGKSATIRAFANLLITTFPDFEPITPVPPNVPPNGDFILVVRINGVVIGITSQGDPGTGLENRLMNLADNHECNIILCSTRTRGETVIAVDRVAGRRGYETIWTSTYQIAGEANQRIVNGLKARHLMDLVQTLGLL
ncbi:hypothetical protein [Fluviicola taffensis]|uniref:Uncharacterized protein n=1 Tax=Fluviicola taffensis (strain DSM 16823 / NCIMB 13979 / RW262) TaxID=755732 RepID=F2I9V8_FLUTR|nr:hypothetical protein [Fluviicola taffensis]AEA44116.1 hypothetical protein Fluta_2130 [Fluviicola taffensis DSM 16823]